MEFSGGTVFPVMLLLLCALLISEGQNMADSTSSSCDYPAIYNFGDSNSDTGGIAAAFFPMAAPCGETYFHRPAGRASDGRLIIDFIADHLGLPFLSPYLDSVGSNFQHGANFATGGATIRRQNESWFETGVSPFPLDIQVEHYTQFKERSAYFYSQDKVASDKSRLPKPEDFSKALYTFDVGQNDLAAAFRKMSWEELRAALPDIVNQFAKQIRGMYERGARAVWIHNTGPIGCLPASTVKVKNPPPGYLDEHGCIKSQNDAAMEFNTQLKETVVQLRAELSGAAITYVDVYSAKYGLISNAKKHGFEEASKVCCGIHGLENDVWCGNKGIVNGSEVYGGSCAEPGGIISWDGVHYTEAANKWIANLVLNGSLSDPPLPIARACHPQI
ncbi:GDSL esterase/lipase At5g14450 [Coffea arabica]|uniref:GDSL esterase/lipase At5g14450 n=1 Tax=Coffea arabica TaxID=13443 RepID=A0A6P6VJA7_COFAR|nr:GDSL esterase/lipase At5g14450 [Coffea arabica]